MKDIKYYEGTSSSSCRYVNFKRKPQALATRAQLQNEPAAILLLSCYERVIALGYQQAEPRPSFVLNLIPWLTSVAEN
jgi:hypothetical protein